MASAAPPDHARPGTAAAPNNRRGVVLSLPWSEIKSILSESFDSWNRHNAPRLGASLAFYSLLSLAPLLLVTVSVVGLVFGHTAAEQQTARQVEALVGPAAGKAAAAFILGSHNTTHGIIATILGLVTLLFSASGVVIELRDALNLIWERPTVTTSGLGIITAYIKQRLFSFAFVLAVGFLLIISLVISAWISGFAALSGSVGPLETVLMHALNALVGFVVIAGLFAAIYKVMPDVHIEWRDVMLGGVVTSALFSIGKLVLGIYLGRASYASMYGAAASIVILIAWIYYSAQIFFLGAEFTRTFSHRYGSRAGSPALLRKTRAARA
ncbi:MAG: YihY/virulence factor BrkB family protein [Acidobacteriaceae bacterium]|nr:YihY/virulence factor BrkB family protein [Acidobacteriaceae bacterium]